MKLFLTFGLLFLPALAWPQNQSIGWEQVNLGFGYSQEWDVETLTLYLKKPSSSLIVYIRPDEKIGHMGTSIYIPFDVKPKLDNRWLWGVTLETDEPLGPAWLKESRGLEGKAWFALRYENNDFNIDAKIPLAYISNNIQWYPRLTFEGLRLKLLDNFYFDSKLEYDGEFGFRENTGLLYKNNNLEAKIGTHGFGIKNSY